MEKTKKALVEHYGKYPNVQIRDVFKFVHQSSFGCEHLVTDEDAAVEYIRKEYEGMVPCRTLVDVLDGDYSRVHLSWLGRGLDAKTLGRLFVLSAKTEAEGRKKLVKKLKAAKTLIWDGALPFSYEDFDAEVKGWEEQGYGAVHHSDAFREAYKPAYRVISNRFVPYLPIFAEIDKRLKSGRVLMAVEGGSASGKSTLGEILSEVYGCTLFHTDDFFLQPHQRTEERLSEVGGNLDRERLKCEVLVPLSKGEAVLYRRFDCGSREIMPEKLVEPHDLTVLEGAYSMHPDLRGYYDFSVFLDVPEEIRRERIKKRNSPEMAKRFFDEWMPMENRYFSGMNIKEKCDIVVGGDFYDNEN